MCGVPSYETESDGNIFDQLTEMILCNKENWKHSGKRTLVWKGEGQQNNSHHYDDMLVVGEHRF